MNFRFFKEGLTPTQLIRFKSKLWRKAFNIFVKEDPTLVEQVKEIYESDQNWDDSNYRSSIKKNAINYVGRKYIINLLSKSFDQLDNIVERFTLPVMNDFEAISQWAKNSPDSKISKIDIKTLTRERVGVRLHRKRIPWKITEDMILLNELKKGKSWIQISPKLEERTNTDCKDRYRVLLRKYKNEENIFLHYNL